jgi:hypothetical protein
LTWRSVEGGKDAIFGLHCVNNNFALRVNSKVKTGNLKLVTALLDRLAANARNLPWRRTRTCTGVQTLNDPIPR